MTSEFNPSRTQVNANFTVGDKVTGSIISLTGSTNFGDTADDTHVFTGSVKIDGAIILTGSAYGSFGPSAPATVVDMSIPTWDGTDGTALSGTNVVIDDNGVISSSFDRDWANIPGTALEVGNTTDATVGVQQQYSPRIALMSTSWNGAASGVGGIGLVGRSTAGGSGNVLEFGYRTAGAWTNTGRVWMSFPNGDISCANVVECGSYLSIGGVMVVNPNSNYVTGLGTCDSVRGMTLTDPVALISLRTEGADNIAIASCWDSATAPGTPPNGKIHSFGWTDSADTYNEVVAINGSGSIKYSGVSNGQFAALSSSSGLVALANGTDTHNTGIVIPSGSMCYAVSSLVQTTIPAGVAITYDVGIAGDTTRFSTGVDEAGGTADEGVGDQLRGYTSDTEIVITTSAVTNADTGRVRIQAHYIKIQPPTS